MMTVPCHHSAAPAPSAHPRSDCLQIWRCDGDTSNRIVHEFFQSRHFVEGIPVIPEARETLTRLSNVCELVVVTSRQHVIQDATLAWLDAHYPGLFSEVYFGNHFAMTGTSRKKSDICRSIGAAVLIDDNVGYARDCADAGINVLLYDWEDGYPWSKLPDGCVQAACLPIVLPAYRTACTVILIAVVEVWQTGKQTGRQAGRQAGCGRVESSQTRQLAGRCRHCRPVTHTTARTPIHVRCAAASAQVYAPADPRRAQLARCGGGCAGAGSCAGSMTHGRSGNDIYSAALPASAAREAVVCSVLLVYAIYAVWSRSTRWLLPPPHEL
jgi:5' nucleotidase, deoxy (Pyrimidine), cytosolic type C protein (NT5C)